MHSVWKPVGAVGLIATETVADVLLLAVTLETFTPAGFGGLQPPVLRYAVVTPVWKLVFWPVIWSCAVEPCLPVVGVTAVMIPAPAVTENTFGSVSCSVLVTLTAVTLMPLLFPKDATVLFAVKWVAVPFTCIVNVVPCAEEVGVILRLRPELGTILIASWNDGANSPFVSAVTVRKPRFAE